MSAAFLFVMVTIIISSAATVVVAFHPRSHHHHHHHHPTIRIINLDRDTERWRNIQRQFQGGVKSAEKKNIHRLPAVYGKALSPKDLQTNATLLARAFCTPGMIGCYLSHRTFWQSVAEESTTVPYQIVLEDDAVIQCANSNEFFECIKEAVQE